jgi:Uma2 family endonuclease
MQTTQTVHQARWNEIVDDPALRDLPYKVETNERGQLVLSPHTAKHSVRQKRVLRHLDKCLSGDAYDQGEAYPEYPIATPGGVKQADAIWASRDRERKMNETGDPPTLAPEICVEVMSPRNSMAEMDEKRALYLEAGAEEVWIVEDDGTVRFYADEELDTSRLAPDFPQNLSS